MATDIEKILRLVTGRSHVGALEAPDAESVLRDESGREYLHLEISVRRDIIREARYTCDSDVSVGLAAAMAAAAGLAENRAIMSASLIGSADIERELSDGGDPSTRPTSPPRPWPRSCCTSACATTPCATISSARSA